MEHKTVNRVMLGDESSPDTIITTNVIINDQVTEGRNNYKGDCEIRFYFGTRPVILHNDTTTDDNEKSIAEYLHKLERIRDMTLEVLEAAETNPTGSYLVREFLNPFEVSDRLFGGTLLILYSARYKMITYDIGDCTNKLRRSFNIAGLRAFADKLVTVINDSISDIETMKGKLRESSKSKA